jgi:anti-sigma factor RsiW
MACFETEILLRYIDAETPPDEAEEMRRHMEHCHDCRHAVRALQALIRNLTQLAGADRQPPSSTTGCVDAVLLAAYIDNRLTGRERERVEHHINSCQDCFDELQAAEQHLTTVSAVPRTVPAALLEKAAALGTPSAPVAPPLWLHCVQQLRRWAIESFPHPQPTWALSGIAVAASLVLVVALSYLRTTPDSVVQTDPGPRMYGYGFGTSADVQVTRSMPLSPVLRSALIAYNAAPTSDDARRQLLTVLGQAPFEIPADQVSTIEIKPALHTLVDRTDRPTVQVTLFRDGLLTIGEAL